MCNSCIAAIALSVAAIARAQSGHWEGSIQAPNGEMKITVDIDKNAKGEWRGEMAVPSQNAKGIPLEPLTVKDNKLTFTIKGVPGEQTFQGPVSADGKSIDGTFTAGGVSVPARLARTGDAQFEAHAKSTAIAKEIEGDWEGVLEPPGNTLHLKLHLANGDDGATGDIISVDQNGTRITISTITQQGSKIKLEVTMVSGRFEGEVSADRKQLVGSWTQGPGNLPLTFKRPAK